MPENNQLQPQPQPQYIYVQQPRFYNGQEEEVEIDLFELISAVWKRKWFILIVSVLAGIAGLVYAFQLPFIYKAECKILPQGGGSSGGLASLVSQYGGLASMMGVSLPSKATAGGTLMAIMKSDSVVDNITDRFNLMEQYKQEYRLNVRKAVLENLGTQEDSMSGVITVSYMDEDPQKAADITNAFVEVTQKKMLDMSLASAQQSRAFFENQLIQAQQELTDAEDAMMKYQQSSGVIAIDQQAKALIEAISNLRTQIAAKNIEISTLKSYAKADNPTLKLAISQLEGMQAELRRLEEEQKKSDSERSNSNRTSNVMPSIESIPELGLEYERYMRVLKIAGAKYELMLKQYETAKLSEISDFSTISIVDPALPPDYKFKPSRAQITLIWAFMGGFLSTCKAAYPNLKKQFMAGKRKKEDDEDDYDDD